ncbi:3-isopropylmalate dehydratase small subunit [Sphingomonas ginkgonis]|uniref:3-isopropylmalate dehydratase n=1 Tax=Sphingomonas ginkgonis TaxID=2315330 RepID=A0A429V6C4_9SPHN|nr:3-isopropylmalate dehydratase small subunit [Sphingomonas ginkgonis]RST29483.1 3-isopropylmalate dehydratase small subunit [Sphingomonas ginkgonis]
MTPFTRVTGRAIPLGLANIDTDVIIGARHLKTLKRTGLGAFAFETIREPFDDPANAGALILVAGDNFGCGSSREHAAWALADLGIRAIISPSFSDIFSGNAAKNGIALVALPQGAVDRLLVAAQVTKLTVDLEEMEVTSGAGDRFSFGMDLFRRHCLLNGLDDIALTLAEEAKIRAYELETGI